MKGLSPLFCALFALAVVLSTISHIDPSYVLRTCVRSLGHIVMTTIHLTLLSVIFFLIAVTCAGLRKPATMFLVETIIDFIHLCETFTTLLLLLGIDMFFGDNNTHHLFKRILLLTFRNVVSRMVPEGQQLSLKMLSESSQAQLQSASEGRHEEIAPVLVQPVLISLELSSYLQTQDSEASDGEVSDDETCVASDEHMSDADSTKGSLEHSPSNITIRPTTFYKVLDSEASPLSEISVAMTDDDTATPAPKGRKFRRSLRRIWKPRETKVADVFASHLSVAATISSGSSSSTESLMSTSMATELQSESSSSPDGTSIASASFHLLEGIRFTKSRKQSTGETLREDRKFGCPQNRRTIAATTRTWLNRCRRIVKTVQA